MLKISKWPRAPAFSTLQNDLNCNSTQGTGTFVWGPETLAELGACGGWGRRLERRGLRGLDKLLTPYYATSQASPTLASSLQNKSPVCSSPSEPSTKHSSRTRKPQSTWKSALWNHRSSHVRALGCRLEQLLSSLLVTTDLQFNPDP